MYFLKICDKLDKRYAIYLLKGVFTVILGSQLKNAIISGSNNISKYKKQINELNIFPVPDGDTGTNMSMTIGAAAEEMKKLEDSATAAQVAKKAASSMLRGARGNSGVILSLLFRGISKGLEEKEEIAAQDLVEALELGVDEAYKAVMKPTEGTILTVARVAAERGREALELGSDPIQVWDAVCMGAADALEETPELLPVLKKAGVVDAGGQGLCLIFEGMLSVFRSGIVLECGLSEEEKAEETAEFFRNVAAEFDSEINFTYCTEFVVGRDPEVQKDPLDLRLFLETIGDCVVVVDDDEIIKTHVHTENPGDALQAALQYGQLLTVKIENMKEQHRKAAEENEAQKAAAARQAPAGKGKPGAPGAHRGDGLYLRGGGRRAQEPVHGPGLRQRGQRRSDHEPLHRGSAGGGAGHPRQEGVHPAQQQEHHHGRGADRAPGHRPGGHRHPHPDHPPGPFRHAGL